MAPAVLNIRTDSQVKEQADTIFKELGLSMSAAVNVFLKQTIRNNGIPFELTLDKPNTETVAAMKEADEILNNPYRKTYKSFKEAREELDV